MENYIIANRSDVGRTRQVNEDSMTTFDSPNGRVVAVCDGMGGQAAGDVASKLACDIIQDILSNNTFASPQEAITRAVLAANQGILHRAAQNPELEGMGSTCVILIIKDNVVTYGWVGDSRIYLLENHTLRQLSVDQSYVQSLVDKGEITKLEAENHPQKNEIINALGIEEMTPPVLGSEFVQPDANMIFMLCSDGLSNVVNDQQIERELNKPDMSLQEKADKLVFLANQYGGPDNITVQLVQFVSSPVAGAARAAKPASNASRSKGKKNQMLVTVMGVLVVLVACLCVFFYIYNNKKTEPVVTEQTTTSGSKTTPTQTKSQPQPQPQAQPQTSKQPRVETTNTKKNVVKEPPKPNTPNPATSTTDAIQNSQSEKTGSSDTKGTLLKSVPGGGDPEGVENRDVL